MFFLKAQRPEIYCEHIADLVRVLRQIEKRLTNLEGGPPRNA
jgi:hypothetical protein